MDLSGIYFDSAESRDIFYFKNHQISSVEPHYHVCVAKRDGGIIILTICTSQEKTIKNYVKYNDSVDESTIVWIKEGESADHPFTKETFINCNNIFEYTKEEFNELKSKGLIKSAGKLSEGKYQSMLEGLHLSNILSGEQKEAIPKSIDDL